MIPTAEEFIRNEFNIDKYNTFDNMLTHNDIIHVCKEFAKMHVKKAIDTCIEEAPSGSSTDPVTHEDVVYCLKDCYPLNNIK